MYSLGMSIRKVPDNWAPPWRPGESGSHGGGARPVKRSKELAEKILYSTQNADVLVRRLVAVANGEIEGAKVSDQLRAIEMLLERAFGKAAQVIEVGGEVVHRNIDDFSDEELRSLVDLRKRIIDGTASPIEDVTLTPHLDDLTDDL